MGGIFSHFHFHFILFYFVVSNSVFLLRFLRLLIVVFVVYESLTSSRRARTRLWLSKRRNVTKKKLLSFTAPMKAIKFFFVVSSDFPAPHGTILGDKQSSRQLSPIKKRPKVKRPISLNRYSQWRFQLSETHDGDEDCSARLNQDQSCLDHRSRSLALMKKFPTSTTAERSFALAEPVSTSSNLLDETCYRRITKETRQSLAWDLINKIMSVFFPCHSCFSLQRVSSTLCVLLAAAQHGHMDAVVAEKQREKIDRQPQSEREKILRQSTMDDLSKDQASVLNKLFTRIYDMSDEKMGKFFWKKKLTLSRCWYDKLVWMEKV